MTTPKPDRTISFSPVETRLTRRRFTSAVSASLLAAASGSTRTVGAEKQGTQIDTAATPVATPASESDIVPQLHVNPTAVRLDERFDVWVTGLEPGQEVTLSSSFTDVDGTEWTAQSAFIADELGVVYPSGQRPISGTYDVPEAMGLIWSAQGNRLHYPSLLAEETVTIAARLDDAVIVEELVARQILPTGIGPTYINQDNIVANFFEPAVGGPSQAPAVIVLGGSDGGLSLYTDTVAAMLAAYGYASLSLAYFGIGSLPSRLESIPLEYFGNAISWLQEQPSIDPDRIGIVGASRGGELALLLGSYYPELKAVVSYVGSGYVHGGGPGPTPSDPFTSAWTWNGEPVSHIQSIEMSEEELRDVEIAVEQINGQVLLISADDDRVWPSTVLSQVAWDHLQRHNHPWPDQFLRYPGAGHIISMPPFMPVPQMVAPEYGGDTLSNSTAMANAWPAVLHHLDAALKYT